MFHSRERLGHTWSHESELSMDAQGGGGGGTLGIFGWGCAAGTLEPLAYTRATSAEFFYPLLD